MFLQKRKVFLVTSPEPIRVSMELKPRTAIQDTILIEEAARQINPPAAQDKATKKELNSVQNVISCNHLCV